MNLKTLRPIASLAQSDLLTCQVPTQFPKIQFLTRRISKKSTRELTVLPLFLLFAGPGT
jgi:hypothetical protein